MQQNSPTVWCLLGRKAGDNTQVRALAGALGWPFEEKSIQARPWELLVHLGPPATLAGIDPGSSDALVPPWPDLVITAGRRNEPVAHWIRERSGGRCKLVHIGRPWAPLESWDLIVTTPQYFLPRRDNILHNQLPLHALAHEQLHQDGERLLLRLERLQHPWLAVLVGGDSGRFVFTADKGARLGRLANALAQAAGGSLLVSDSPRTPAAASQALQRELTVPHFSYHWGDAGENPYRGMLALADAFIVTGESMSMLGEAAAMGKPLFIFDTGDGDTPWWRLAHNYRYKPLSHRLAMRLGPERMRRDVGNIQTRLVEGGNARWLTEESIDLAATSLATNRENPAPTDDLAGRELQRAADCVIQLMAQPKRQ